jgi:pimeloyl-ACP methyl ester carboxylesterase
MKLNFKITTAVVFAGAVMLWQAPAQAQEAAPKQAARSKGGAGRFIMAAPMGYNTGGWYGSPIINTGGRGGKGAPAPEPPANLSELSEKDAMNVLDMMRKEFNVDDKRTYLMGHSMGGAGTLYLGSKYASD